MPPPFPKTAPAAVRLLGSFTLTLLRKNSNTFLLLSLTFFGGKKKRELGAWKRQGRKKDGRLYNLWLSQQTISPLFSVWGGEKWGSTTEKAEETERGEAARAMLFYGSCHMDEGAARPWERTLTFNNRASTGPPGLFSPERRAPQGAIRAWIGPWQPCAAPQGIHKRWHIDSPCLCAASVWKREGLEGRDSFSLIRHWQKLGY